MNKTTTKKDKTPRFGDEKMKKKNLDQVKVEDADAKSHDISMNSSEWGEQGDRIASKAAQIECLSSFSSDNEDHLDKVLHKLTKNDPSKTVIPEFDIKKDDMYEPYNNTVFESNEENILDDAEYIYDYINKVLGVEEKNIIIFGRSMGSGPATHVTSVRNPGCLLLMSSFKSIRAIAQDQAGSFLKYLIQDRFQNVEKIKKVTSPTFIVHGMKDQLIPFQHSKDLHDNCGGPCSLILPTKMNHNDFDFCEDLITPFYHFLK